MDDAEDFAYIAVSITGDNPVFAVGLPEAPKSYRVRCESSVKEANFVIPTGNLIGERKQQLELLKSHGFTVVRQEKWIVRNLESDFTTRQEIVHAALREMTELYAGGRKTVSGYNEEFAEQVLQVLISKFPSKMQVLDLKRDMSPEPSDGDLMTALEALYSDGYITGQLKRSSTSGRRELIALANIESTKVGRDYLKLQPAAAPAVIHGDTHYHAPVAIIHDNENSSVSVNQQMVTPIPEIDWNAVASEFAAAFQSKLSPPPSTSDEYAAIANLIKVREEAEKRNSSGFIKAVLKMGQAALPILAKAGAHTLVGHFEQKYGWKLD